MQATSTNEFNFAAIECTLRKIKRQAAADELRLMSNWLRGEAEKVADLQRVALTGFANILDARATKLEAE